MGIGQVEQRQHALSDGIDQHRLGLKVRNDEHAGPVTKQRPQRREARRETRGLV